MWRTGEPWGELTARWLFECHTLCWRHITRLAISDDNCSIATAARALPAPACRFCGAPARPPSACRWRFAYTCRCCHASAFLCSAAGTRCRVYYAAMVPRKWRGTFCPSLFFRLDDACRDTTLRTAFLVLGYSCILNAYSTSKTERRGLEHRFRCHTLRPVAAIPLRTCSPKPRVLFLCHPLPVRRRYACWDGVRRVSRRWTDGVAG